MRHVFGLCCLAGLLLAGCTPSTPATCGLNDVGDFNVTYTKYGQPVLQGTLDNQTVHFMLDSGSDTSVLSVAAYYRLNLRGLTGIEGYSTGVGGNAQDNAIIMRDVTFGGLTVKYIVFLVGNYGSNSRHAHDEDDGLIGEDVLHRFDIGYDLPDNKISLYLPQNCPVTAPPFAGQFAALPITHVEGKPDLIPYQIDSQTLNFVLDSGSSDTFVEQSALDRLGIKPEAVSSQPEVASGLGGLKLTQRREQFNSVTIGAETFSDLWLSVGRSHLSDMQDGLLGDDYLATHKVFVSNSTHTIYFGLTAN